jgi:cobalt-zinc-cadmium resistance protein CzcA
MGAEVQRPLATVVIGGVISAMLMTLLVGRVIYLLFDRLAGALVWTCNRAFGLHADQLAWLVGEYREEMFEANDRDSRSGTVGVSIEASEESYA